MRRYVSKGSEEELALPTKKPVKPSYQPTKSMRERLAVVSVITLAGAGVLFVNLFHTSVTEHDKYAAMANDSQFKSTTVEANRGSIYTADGKILAQSATVYNIIVNPSAITGLSDEKYSAAEKDKMIKDTAQILSEVLGVDYDKAVSIFTDDATKNRQYSKVASKVEKDKVSELNTRLDETDLPTNLLSTEEDTKRYYPQGDMAAAVIGFTNYDGDGVYSAEA